MSITWVENVNTRVLRNSEWSFVVGTIAEETRCGTRRVRMGNCYKPASFSVRMRFTPAEKEAFLQWFKTNAKYGAESFLFPKIDDTSGTLTAYRFTPDSAVSFDNPSGNIINVSMEWEEV